ncbi:MAG: gamma carbonic anhydrase family protein [Candidatus Thermoplasmatota archaeon]
MAVYEFEGKVPTIGKGTYLFESADVIGDVSIGEGCYVGPGARIRGDYGTIVIGDGTAIEDNCVLHARPGERLEIGKMVTIGHGAIIHNCTLKDFALVGMGAVVSDYAVVHEWAVVGEGAVVKNKQVIPPKSIVVGVPAKQVAEVTPEYIAQWKEFKGIYRTLAEKRYPEGLRRSDG